MSMENLTPAPASLRSLSSLYDALNELYFIGENENEIFNLLDEIEQAEQEQEQEQNKILTLNNK